MKLFFYCKRQLQMYMTYTWSQITITFKNVYSVLYMLVIHFFQTFEIFRFISSEAFLNKFCKFFKNNTIIAEFFKGNSHGFFFRLCIILETLVYRRILAICRQNCIPYSVGTFSFLLKVSVPPRKPNKFLQINQEVFQLLIPPRYTKMLRNPNGHFL